MYPVRIWFAAVCAISRLVVEWAPFEILHIVHACVCSFLSFPRLFVCHCLVSSSDKEVAPWSLADVDLLGPPPSVHTLQWHREATGSTTTRRDDDCDNNWDDHNDDDECRCCNKRRWSTAAAGDATHSVSIATALLGPRRRTAEFPDLVDATGELHLLGQRGPTTQLASEYKNHLLFSLLGSGGMNHFASNPFI